MIIITQLLGMYLVSRLIRHWQFVVTDSHGLRRNSDVCNERHVTKKSDSRLLDFIVEMQLLMTVLLRVSFND